MECSCVIRDAYRTEGGWAGTIQHWYCHSVSQADFDLIRTQLNEAYKALTVTGDRLEKVTADLKTAREALAKLYKETMSVLVHCKIEPMMEQPKPQIYEAIKLAQTVLKENGDG